MPRRAQTAIERLQPYHRRKHPELRALLWLERLCNIDKHRTLHLTSTHMERSRYFVGGTGLLSVQRVEIFQRPFKVGAMLARVTPGPLPPGEEREMHVDMHIVPDILFEKGSVEKSAPPQSVLGTLYAIRNVIGTDVVPKLNPFFPKGERITLREYPRTDQETPARISRGHA